MTQEKCFECGLTDNIHHHHVVPKILGGTKTIPLCETCHGKVHDRKFLNHRKLTLEGLKKAKDKGKILGTPKNLNRDAIVKGKKVRIHNAKNNDNWLLAIKKIKEYIEENGDKHLTKISEKLNNEGHRTRNGKLFKPTTVKRLLERI